MNDTLKLALSNYRGGSIHGPRHWARVERNALALAAATPGADAALAQLFAILHDCCRISDSHDPEHGHRAAELCSDPLLAYAVRWHADGLTSNDPTVGVCWDADRLDLTRLGVRPDPRLLSTVAGRDGVWLHATSEYAGPTLAAEPRPPLRRFRNEPLDPRICVCPSEAGCFAAVGFEPGPVHLYVCSAPAVQPVGVWDAAITGERWITPPVTLLHWRTIPAEVAAAVQYPRVARGWARVAHFVHCARLLQTDLAWAAKLERLLPASVEEVLAVTVEECPHERDCEAAAG